MRLFIAIFIVFLGVDAVAQQYRSDTVLFHNGDIALSGTLSFPQGEEGPYPAIVLIAGSGAQNRDSNLMGFKVFKIMADAFNQSGIAVLRYDERGVGESTGKSVMQSTTAELAKDAAAAVDYLYERPEIDNSKIGMLGHSEGGIIVPKVAVETGRVAFLLLLAGPGMPGCKVIESQQRAILSANPNFSKEYIDATVSLNTKVIAMMSDSTMAKEEVVDKAAAEINKSIDLMPESIQGGIANRELFSKTQAQNAYKQINIPWMKYFLTYDPIPVLRKVNCPILLVFGAKDTQVTAEQNLAPMIEALKEGGNDEVTVKVFENANHLFQEAATGSPQEYGALSKAFVPALLPYLSTWLKDVIDK